MTGGVALHPTYALEARLAADIVLTEAYYADTLRLASAAPIRENRGISIGRQRLAITWPDFVSAR
jgi:hypothetical protein